MDARKKGFTLLEILLVLVIVSSIILMTVRYFKLTIRNTQTTQAISEIKLLTKTSYEWLTTERQENFSNNPNGVAITLQKLIESGLVATNDKNNPSQYLDPWGGTIEVNPGSDPNYLKITFNNVPKKSCLNLLIKTQSLFRKGSPLPLCQQTRNQFFGEF